MADYKRILCATDFSPASVLALRHADDLARRLGARLTIVHVVQDALQQPWTAEAYALNLADLEGEWVRCAQTELARLAATCTTKPVTVCRQGKPVQAILECVRDTRADLLVVGSHGHGVLAQMILGSVAERLIRHAPCPVLAVREQSAGEAGTHLAETGMAAASPRNPIV